MHILQGILVINEFLLKETPWIGCEIKCTNWCSGEEYSILSTNRWISPKIRALNPSMHCFWGLLTSLAHCIQNANESQPKTNKMKREIALFKQLTHPNIVKFVKVAIAAFLTKYQQIDD